MMNSTINPTFADIYKTESSFLADYKASGIYLANTHNRMSDSGVNTLYWLLYSKFGNWDIAMTDTYRFKASVWSLMFAYGPTWEKRLDLQNKIRNITDSELEVGTQSIYNHAYNPGTVPSTATLTELTAINEQNTTNVKKSKIDKYAEVYGLLATDVTTDFLNKFRKLFSISINPQRPILYVTEED